VVIQDLQALRVHRVREVSQDQPDGPELRVKQEPLELQAQSVVPDSRERLDELDQPVQPELSATPDHQSWDCLEI